MKDSSRENKIHLRNPLVRDKFGRTPLMFAALADYPECAEALLKHGARPQLKDRSGRTAMHWAAHHGNVGCLKIIYGKSKQVRLYPCPHISANRIVLIKHLFFLEILSLLN